MDAEKPTSRGHHEQAVWNRLAYYERQRQAQQQMIRCLRRYPWLTPYGAAVAADRERAGDLGAWL